MKQKVALTIAGSDSSGGAGIQNDLKTFHNLGVHGCSAITAITAQNPNKISEIVYLPAESVISQINLLQDHLSPHAIKIGMLGDIGILAQINHFLAKYSGYVVLDPVLISTSGKKLFNMNLCKYLSELKKIFPWVDLLTPNFLEAEKIVNRELKTYEDIEHAAREILALGVKSVLIKGGHDSGDFSQDYWSNGVEAFWLANQRYPQRNYHGTGCALSAAITACLALGYSLKDAVVIGKMYVNHGIRLSEKIDKNSAWLAHGGWPEEQIDLPYLSQHPIQHLSPKFVDCGPESIGLYPIIDHSHWLEKLIPLGVKTFQLRIKNKSISQLKREIRTSVELAKKYKVRLFINDYWEFAIQYQAYGVHLGQEDIVNADIAAIRTAGLRLGISTHCYYEVARAHALQPSYLACGPIFATTSKLMSFAPQGITQLKRWRRTLNYPLVAIGGINLQTLSEVLATGVNGVAMISAITQSSDPVGSTQKLLLEFHTRNADKIENVLVLPL